MNILAIGAHVGDGELMAGPYLCQALLDGHRSYMLALTAGERGNPELEPEVYKVQKLEEARIFSEKSGIEYQVFSDVPDAYLVATNDIVERVKKLILEKQITHVFTHWRGSFHPDHRQAHDIASQAVLQINLLRKTMDQINLLYCENWEDMDRFAHEEYFPITQAAFDLWRGSIEHARFVHGAFSKFRYLDYYSALLIIRGCLSDNARAVSMMRERIL